MDSDKIHRHRHNYDAMVHKHTLPTKIDTQPKPMDPTINFCEEQMRKESFEGNWPSERFKPSVSKMIAAGFVYVGPGDFVECYKGCGIKLHKWVKDDDPKEEHKDYQKKWKILCDLYPEVTESDIHAPDPDQPETA